jgi:hypothetical protein
VRYAGIGSGLRVKPAFADVPGADVTLLRYAPA